MVRNVTLTIDHKSVTVPENTTQQMRHAPISLMSFK